MLPSIQEDSIGGCQAQTREKLKRPQPILKRPSVALPALSKLPLSNNDSYNGGFCALGIFEESWVKEMNEKVEMSLAKREREFHAWPSRLFLSFA